MSLYKAAKMKLGGGVRFRALKEKLSHQKGVDNPAGLAASIGRKKYGPERFNRMAARGRKD